MDYALVVDDDPTNRKILHKMLTGMRYEVLCFASAEKCLDYCKNALPRLILLDYHLGQEMSGHQFLVELRKIEAGSDVPVIMCSGENKEQSLKELLKLGISGYLLKPFKEDDLLNQLRRIHWLPTMFKKE